MKRREKAASPALLELAKLHWIQPAFRAASGKREVASEETLRNLLEVRGIDLSDADESLQARRSEILSTMIQPVTVAWRGRRQAVPLNVPVSLAETIAGYRIDLESGETVEGSYNLSESAVVKSSPSTVTRALKLPQDLPAGYHTLSITLGSKTTSGKLFVAPVRAFPGESRKTWGIFAPLYAVHSETSWGAGDLADLRRLMRLVSSYGGSILATLPILAAYLDDPFESSPYSPVSRLFWNEFYADLSFLDDVPASAAREVRDLPQTQQAIERLRRADLVDYGEQMKLKRAMLERSAQTFFAQGDEAQRLSFERFLHETPAAERYAAFRAVTERHRKPWQEWPQPLREGTLADGDFDSSARDYHLYVQWLMHEQMQDTARHARDLDLSLYLDFPLGVNSNGFDAWNERELFCSGANVGAPPDLFFTKGQNWGFRPIDPDASRATGHDYFIRSVRHQMRHAGILRIDHVMALHRLYWIPEGQEAARGAYVNYPAEELYAALAIESHRHQTMVVGEDLGTVPEAVRRGMRRHGIRGMYVVQYEVHPDADPPLKEPAADMVASVNTHDMPTFASFWNGDDIDERLELDLLDEEGARRERAQRGTLRARLADFLKLDAGVAPRSGDAPPPIGEAVAFLARSAAGAVLVNVEDLWSEREPQNTPGTGDERPNWRRRFRRSLEEIEQDSSITSVFASVDRLRAG